MPAEALWAVAHPYAVLPRADETTTSVAETTAEVATAKDPSPLTVAPKELFWSLGSFLVLLALMRLVFYPKLRAGVDARQGHITGTRAAAEAARAAAQSEIAEYDEALAAVRTEAQGRVDAAARTVEAERAARMAGVNAAIAERRAVANSEIDAAKAAVSSRVAEAARDVVGAATQHVLGRTADAAVLQASVDRAMGAGVPS